ncbi:MAG: PucR family transcriptional regulator [Nocardioidaceae bacterium]
MSAAESRTSGAVREPAARTFLEAFDEVSEAVESGAGLPAVTRAAGRALASSVVVLDSASAVLAAACASTEDERAVLAGEGGTEAIELRVADAVVGRLRHRPQGAPPPSALLRMVANLIAYEVERCTAPARATEAAVADFVGDVLERRVTDRDDLVARAGELGCDVSVGASVLIARARPSVPEEGDWRARVLTLAERGARAVERTSLAALVRLSMPSPHRELVLVVPGAGADPGRRAAAAVLRELEAGLSAYVLAVALSRPVADPGELHRAGAEALLAANVAEARGLSALSFDDTGAYRLLLPAMSEDPSELRRFHEETVAPLVAYDEQYETELVHTLESFLDADANVAKTAEKLFTHRHTVRYRLDRVKELSGLDVGSTDGRERLSLGLKAMRVLGIVPPGGPAYERGAGGGRVPREGKDR